MDLFKIFNEPFNVAGVFANEGKMVECWLGIVAISNKTTVFGRCPYFSVTAFAECIVLAAKLRAEYCCPCPVRQTPDWGLTELKMLSFIDVTYDLYHIKFLIHPGKCILSSREKLRSHPGQSGLKRFQMNTGLLAFYCSHVRVQYRRESWKWGQERLLSLFRKSWHLILFKT